MREVSLLSLDLPIASLPRCGEGSRVGGAARSEGAATPTLAPLRRYATRFANLPARGRETSRNQRVEA